MSLPKRSGEIFSHLPAFPSQTFPDVLGELNLAANHEAQWCPALRLYAHWHFMCFHTAFFQLVQPHLLFRALAHTQMLNLQGKHPHSLG